MAHHQRGGAVCSNGLTKSMACVDDAVLASCDRDLLQPGPVMALFDGVLKTLQPTTRAKDEQRMRGDLQRLDREIERYTEAIASGGGQLPTILDALKMRQARRTTLAATLTTINALDGLRLPRKQIAEQVRGRLNDWRSRLLGGNVAEGRQFLREIDAPFLFTPDGSRYLFEARVRGERVLAGVVDRPLGRLQPLWCARQDLNLRPPV